jgi:hypothetical protein
MLAMASVQWGQQCHHDNCKDACALIMAMMPLWQGQQHQLEDGNNVKMATTPSQQGQQGYCDNGKDAWTAKTPAHQWWQHHHNESDDPSSMTAKMPVHQWQQQLHCYKGNDASSMTMLAWLQQRRHCKKGNNCHCNDSKDTCASTTTTPWQQGQQCHRDDGKDTCASIMTMMPLQQGWQHQLEDGNNALTKRETTPSLIKGNDAILTRATTPAQWLQGHLHIDNGDDNIVMRATIAIGTTAKTPAHQRQWCHHNKDNNASSMTSNKGNNASSTMREMPAHQWRQQCHHDKSNNCHCNNGKDACASMATTPSQQGW